MKMIYLYQPNDVLLERGLQVDALAAYTKRLVAKANAVLSAAGPTAGASGALVVALKPPARSKVWVMVGEKAREAEFTSALRAPLESVPPPTVSGIYAFAIAFEARGGGEPLKTPSPLPIPDEWTRAVARCKLNRVLPDCPLEMIWPD